LHVALVTVSPPAAPCRVMRVMAGCACAARVGERRALRLPSSGAMRSCADRRRRALHDQGRRAVRHCGHIRHQSSRGTCWEGQKSDFGPDARSGAGVGGRRASSDCGGQGCAGCSQGGGGVVSMADRVVLTTAGFASLNGNRAVTFKGGSISNTFGVRARPLHLLRVAKMLMLYVSRCARRRMPVVGMPRGVGGTSYASTLQ
jgi:hypothetical protein